MTRAKPSRAYWVATCGAAALGALSLAYLVYLGLFDEDRAERRPARNRRCTAKPHLVDCDRRVLAVPTKKACPAQGRIAPSDIGKYRITVQVNSPDFCFANVRADTFFKKGHHTNILARLDHGQPFCAARRGSFFWELVLNDEGGRLCKGYLSSALAECGQDPSDLLGIDCKKPPFALPIRTVCPAGAAPSEPPNNVKEMRVSSPHHCYANVRSSGKFQEEDKKNILARVRHGRPFCGTGPFKYRDPETGEKGAVYYRALLKDPAGRLCWGHISMTLVDPRGTETPPAVPKP